MVMYTGGGGNVRMSSRNDLIDDAEQKCRLKLLKTIHEGEMMMKRRITVDEETFRV